jgi:hypothetical protein
VPEQDSQFRALEKDLIPDGDKLSVVPNYAAPEGTEVTYLNGNVFRRYRMVDGSCRAIGAEWTPYQTFTWSAEALAKSFTSLPAHDMWKIEFSLAGGANNRSLALRLNNISTASYNSIVTAGTDTGNTYARVFDMNAVNYIGGEIRIDGRLQNSLLGYSGLIMGNTTAASLNNRLISGAVAAAADVSQIDIIEVGGTETNFTGKGVLSYRDF